jgi:hypothetical protein
MINGGWWFVLHLKCDIGQDKEAKKLEEGTN